MAATGAGPAGWGPVLASLQRGQVPQVEPALQADEWVLLLGPPAVFWACVWFWQLVVWAFPRHAAAHVLKGPTIRSPSLLKARARVAFGAFALLRAHRTVVVLADHTRALVRAR